MIHTFNNTTGSSDAFFIGEWIKALGYDVRSTTVSNGIIEIFLYTDLTSQEKIDIQLWLDNYIIEDPAIFGDDIADQTLLKTEITNDPLTLGYSGMSNQQIVDSIMTVNRPYYNMINSRSLLKWAASNSRLANISEAASTLNLSKPIRSIAAAAEIMIRRDGTNLDLNGAEEQGMINALVGASVLTEGDRDSLYALATTTVSRATELKIGIVTLRDVVMAKV